jgi:hemerythrin superfamily protein
MTERLEKKRETDVVTLLTQQHEEIRRLFEEVSRERGERRAEAFDRLRRLLAVHETAEEEIVHPMVRRSVSNGNEIIDARLREETEAKKILQALQKMGPASPVFDALFAEFRTAVLEHAEQEEREEFVELRAHSGEKQLRVMAAAVKVAQAIAPTHPHPVAETAPKNLLVGPLAALADRTRDFVRKARRRRR